MWWMINSCMCLLESDQRLCGFRWGVGGKYRMFSHTVENDKASHSHRNQTHETASQRQRFLGLNKGPGIFLRMRQEAVSARIGHDNER
jgi:hypothetical protein